MLYIVVTTAKRQRTFPSKISTNNFEQSIRPRLWSDMKPHLHLQEKVLRRNCFSCVQPFRSWCKKATHLHTKDISSRPRFASPAGDQPFGSNWLSNANNLLGYANDIRKNWHSGGLNLNCKFSTIVEDSFSVAENGKNFHFSARDGMSSRRCDDYLMPSLAIRINDYEFTQSLRQNILLEEFPAQSFLRSLRGRRGEARLKIASTPIVTKSSVLKERRHSTSLHRGIMVQWYAVLS